MSLVTDSWPVKLSAREHYLLGTLNREVVLSTWLKMLRQVERLKPWFSSAECEYVACLPVIKRQVDWLAGRLVAKTIAQCLQPGQAASQIVVQYDSLGRPFWLDRYCSLSHTEARAVATVAYQPIGVDVEMLSGCQSDTFAQIILPQELKVVGSMLSCQVGLAQAFLWSIKEALYKATGQQHFSLFAESVRLYDWQQNQLRWQVAPSYLSLLTEHDQRNILGVWHVDYVIEPRCLEVILFNPIPA